MYHPILCKRLCICLCNFISLATYEVLHRHEHYAADLDLVILQCEIVDLIN